jgi:hypothetical protein
MSDSHFTPEIFEQKEIGEKECQKLQALLDEQSDEVIILDNSVYDKFKRPREDNDENDNNNDNEDDDEDEPEVKPKVDVLFKREEDDNDDDNHNHDDNADDNDEDEDLIHYLSRFAQQLQDVPVTWGMNLNPPGHNFRNKIL